MRNPFRQLKYLPWLALFQAAALTLLAVSVVDIALIMGLRIAVMRQAIVLLFAPPLGILMLIGISSAIGALAVYILRRFFRRQVMISVGVLWALVLCVMVLMVVRSLLPVPSLLIQANQLSLVGVVLGVFLSQGRVWR
ncbi:MAG TPA: hypothetical protein V6C88_15390 [Chroococcidiopsis sp.]